MIALDLLKKNTNASDRATNYITPIIRNIRTNVIDKLISSQENILDQILDLKDFSLATDINAGVKQLTREDCEKRFIKIIDLECEYELAAAILAVKQKSFNKYFTEDETDPEMFK